MSKNISIAEELKKLGIQLSDEPFKPVCRYNAELDMFEFIACDCSYTTAETENSYIERLTHNHANEETIGIVVRPFSRLPREMRDKLIAATEVELDSIDGIEKVWMLNARERDPEIDAAEAAFFEELRQIEPALRS